MYNLYLTASRLQPPACASLVAALPRLQNLIRMADSSAGRGIIGPLNNLSRVGLCFNHSMPIMPAVSGYDLFLRDPHAIAPELRYLLTNVRDTRASRFKWRRILGRCGIVPRQPPAEDVLFSDGPLNSWRLGTACLQPLEHWLTLRFPSPLIMLKN